MSRDSTARVLSVAFVLCVVCSIMVSAAAVGLSDRQERNKAEEKKKNILQAAGLYEVDVSIEEQFSKIETRIVDLQSGEFTLEFDVATFDSRSAARDPETRYRIPPDLDLAAIKARSRYKDVYLVMAGDELQQLILPVHGKGLWSTMYGFISLANDFSTVNGFAFYEHGETPGLGGEIDNPAGKSSGPAKKFMTKRAKPASKFSRERSTRIRRTLSTRRTAWLARPLRRVASATCSSTGWAIMATNLLSTS